MPGFAPRHLGAAELEREDEDEDEDEAEAELEREEASATAEPDTAPDMPPGFPSHRRADSPRIVAQLELRRTGASELELSAFNDGEAAQHFRVPGEEGTEPHYDWRVFQRDAHGRWRLVFRYPADPPDVPAHWSYGSPQEILTLQPGERRVLPLHLPAGPYPLDREQPVVVRVAVGWRVRLDEAGNLALPFNMEEAPPLVLSADEWLQAVAAARPASDRRPGRPRTPVEL